MLWWQSPFSSTGLTTEVRRREDDKRGEINTWLGTSNLPPSKAGRRVALQWSFWKVEEKMPLQGSTARLKAAVLLFHSALTGRLQTTVNLSVFVLVSSQGLWSSGWRAAGGGIVSHQGAFVWSWQQENAAVTAPYRPPHLQHLSQK